MITGTSANFNANNAYKVAQKMLDQSAASAGVAKNEGSSFGNMVVDAAKNTVGEVQRAEQVAADAVAGKANINEVVNAVNSADVALKTIVSVRDKVISAYQDIIKMPI